MDPNTPIEETMRVLKSLVESGVIRYIGLSECTPSELRRAHAIHPVTAIQMEWSLQTRSIEAEIVPTARELGVGLVAYSPLARGLLSACIQSRDQLDNVDFRKTNPRFSEANLAANVPKAAFVELAARKGVTPAQLSLAWLHAQGVDVFPIPGTKSVTRLKENAAAVFVGLTKEEVEEVEAAVPLGVGERYAGMAGTFDSRL
jgi:aryl-alcohol dehydrogenase-like predicted oxidoreductase